MWGPILAWVRKQIGQRTDTASATGSVHAKTAFIAAYMSPKNIEASDVLKTSADTERSNKGSVYTKLKEIKTLADGVARIKFDLKSTTANSAYGRIYINGVAVGTERTVIGSTYQTFTEDIIVQKYDLIQLYVKAGSEAYTTVVRNFRIYYDFSTDMDIVLTD